MNLFRRRHLSSSVNPQINSQVHEGETNKSRNSTENTVSLKDHPSNNDHNYLDASKRSISLFGSKPHQYMDLNDTRSTVNLRKNNYRGSTSLDNSFIRELQQEPGISRIQASLPRTMMKKIDLNPKINIRNGERSLLYEDHSRGSLENNNSPSKISGSCDTRVIARIRMYELPKKAGKPKFIRDDSLKSNERHHIIHRRRLTMDLNAKVDDDSHNYSNNFVRQSIEEDDSDSLQFQSQNIRLNQLNSSNVKKQKGEYKTNMTESSNSKKVDVLNNLFGSQNIRNSKVSIIGNTARGRDLKSSVKLGSKISEWRIPDKKQTGNNSYFSSDKIYKKIDTRGNKQKSFVEKNITQSSSLFQKIKKIQLDNISNFEESQENGSISTLKYIADDKDIVNNRIDESWMLKKNQRIPQKMVKQPQTSNYDSKTRKISHKIINDRNNDKDIEKELNKVLRENINLKRDNKKLKSEIQTLNQEFQKDGIKLNHKTRAEYEEIEEKRNLDPRSLNHKNLQAQPLKTNTFEKGCQCLKFEIKNENSSLIELNLLKVEMDLKIKEINQISNDLKASRSNSDSLTKMNSDLKSKNKGLKSKLKKKDKKIEELEEEIKIISIKATLQKDVSLNNDSFDESQNFDRSNKYKIDQVDLNSKEIDSSPERKITSPVIVPPIFPIASNINKEMKEIQNYQSSDAYILELRKSSENESDLKYKKLKKKYKKQKKELNTVQVLIKDISELEASKIAFIELQNQVYQLVSENKRLSSIIQNWK